VNITIWDTIAVEGYKLERINSLGTHTGTHMSAPCHFLAGPQYLCIDTLPPSAFIFTAALIDVSERVAQYPSTANFHLSWEDILAYEASVRQQIPKDAVVMLYTGFSTKFGTSAYADGPFPGFTADAVNQLYQHRQIKGMASDTFGPDASDDSVFSASTASYDYLLLHRFFAVCSYSYPFFSFFFPFPPDTKMVG
jgi:kynurenine formamidase